MTDLVARRFAGLILTLVVVSVFIFTVMDLLPGDPASIMLGTSASPDTLAALQRELGLDRPLPLRYVEWLGGVLQGDLGVSYTYGVPVAGLIGERLAVTLPLASMAILVSLVIAIPLTGWAGSSATGIDVMIADRWTVPPLVEASEDGEAYWFRLHDILTKLLVALITVHMLGAFKREMEGDGTLTRMIRGRP